MLAGQFSYFAKISGSKRATENSLSQNVSRFVKLYKECKSVNIENKYLDWAPLHISTNTSKLIWKGTAVVVFTYKKQFLILEKLILFIEMKYQILRKSIVFREEGFKKSCFQKKANIFVYNFLN